MRLCRRRRACLRTPTPSRADTSCEVPCRTRGRRPSFRSDPHRPGQVTTALTHMFNVARSPRFKLIQDNPASHVEKPDPRNERDRIASVEKCAKLKATAAPHLLWLLTIAYAVGPRRGELLKLEWPNVDMRRKEFTLRKIKNRETRVVPMIPDVHEVFSELWKDRRLDTNRVFLYKGKPWKNHRTTFAAACRKAGITGLRPHDLRHTASTILRRAVVDTMTAMKIVGHKSEQMHRRYNTIQPEDLHEAAAKLEKYTANTVITLASPSATRQGVSGVIPISGRSAAR